MDDGIFTLLAVIFTILSLIFSFGLILSLNKRKSTYARIMRHIVISETMFIFCQMMVVIDKQVEQYNNAMCSFMQVLLLGMTSSQDCVVIKIFNYSSYYALQCFSNWLSVFICLEMILILKNPIAQMRNRVKTYFFIATFCSLLVFIISIFHIDTFKEPSDLFIAEKAPIIINIIIFFLLVIIGGLSCIYIFVRFCIGKSIIVNLKNWFVIRHFIYVFFNIFCLALVKINEIRGLSNKEFQYKEFAFLINLSMGFIMFIIRATETNFYRRILCRNLKKNINLDNSIDNNNKTTDEFFERDQPLTAIISRNMNLEFMCCILFGLSEIFMKPERKKISEDETKLYSQEESRQEDNTITLLPQSSGLNDKSLLNINKKDFRRVKTHKIHYKKIFDDNIDFENLEVEVRSSNRRKRTSHNTIGAESEFNTTNEEDIKIKQDHDALIIEYCPKIFRELRKNDDISGSDLDKSLNPALNSENMNKIRESEGKSGSFFFFSHDNKFIIKTITNNELNNMLGNFMKCYYDHVSSYPETLLAKIYGIYSIIIKGVSKINIILMQNLININPNHIKRIFDLKGSRVDRVTKNIEKCSKMKALKDLDYLWMIDIEEDLVDFTKDHCEELSNVLMTDLRMLREVSVMDYSLLLIIIYFPKETDPDYQSIFNLFADLKYCRRIFKSNNKKYIYILGIIDYLQKFNVAKFFENKYKSIVYGNEIKYVSAVDPMIYSDRMLEFAKSHIFINKK